MAGTNTCIQIFFNLLGVQIFKSFFFLFSQGTAGFFCNTNNRLPFNFPCFPQLGWGRIGKSEGHVVDRGIASPVRQVVSLTDMQRGPVEVRVRRKNVTDGCCFNRTGAVTTFRIRTAAGSSGYDGYETQIR